MKVNKKAVQRLFHYKNLLLRLQEDGVTRIYSDTLAERLGVTSSQVRKDFSLFNIKGNKKAGYVIGELVDRMDEIFRNDVPRRVVIVGYGRIGSALANYNGFHKQNIEVCAAFDIDPAKIAPHGAVPVYHLNDLKTVVGDTGAQIGILAVPERVAQESYRLMADAGIAGVLNFAPIILSPIAGCMVTSYCVEGELNSLMFAVDQQGEQG
ncbi:MAG: redox-sensing transcriptional repressor Rex [Fibrobacterota bacterium]